MPSGKNLKGRESSGRIVPEPLVRMRSPVRIWLAAPKDPGNPMISGIFVVFPREKIRISGRAGQPTHTLTHKRIEAERPGKGRNGNGAWGGGTDPRGERQPSFPICLRALCERDFFFVYRSANSEQRRSAPNSFPVYLLPARTLPIVSAAWTCMGLVAWV